MNPQHLKLCMYPPCTVRPGTRAMHTRWCSNQLKLQRRLVLLDQTAVPWPCLHAAQQMWVKTLW